MPRSLASPGPGWALWWGRGRKKGTASPRKSLPSLPRQQNPAGKAQQGKPERAPALCLFGRAALGGSPAVGRLSRRPARKYDGYSHSTMSHRKSQQHSSPREENVVGNFPRRRGIPSRRRLRPAKGFLRLRITFPTAICTCVRRESWKPDYSRGIR